MLKRTHPTRSDHRDRYRQGNRPRQFDIIPLSSTVPIHTSEQDLTRAVGLHPLYPRDRIEPGRCATAMNVHFPTWSGVRGLEAGGRSFVFRVDRYDDAL